MIILRYARLIPALALLAAATNLHAENWPMWRGAKGDGISNDANPPLKWSESENITWIARPPGSGSSTPIVWDQRIFLTSQTEDEKEWLVCIDRWSAEIVWQRLLGQGMTKTRAGANMASASPATDGRNVVASVGTGELACFDFEGNEKWKIDLQKEHGEFTIWWGYSNSPVIHEGRVLVTLMNEGPSYLLALDVETGTQVWKTPRKTGCESEPCDSYATPLVYKSGDKTEIFLTGQLWATGYDFDSGELNWKAEIGGDRTILSPIHYDGSIYTTAGKRGAVHAIRTGGKGDVTKTHIDWTHDESTPDCPGPVASGPYVFLVNDGGVGMCIRRSDGKMMWKERIGGDMKASPVVAAGNVYFTNREGKTIIVKASDKFEIVAENGIGEDATMASLAFSDGQIFLRGMSALYCIGRRARSAAAE